ncbi:diadenosine tetraphosphatase [Antarctobacter heliothermus]|uniref:Diadenosine tetraphosphatase n=1 Tax=Antarctobacter heliothermus TaxID=74033 RepID=A0A222E1W1_9RHOB|nr:metallophosphoesterase family protein [Antarctobacter heliothermus]ASP20143.1 diadenosine tetraphosphatase [Antarctobacter heliothermus]
MIDTLYAIGDIHGQLAMLEDALDRIERDGGPNARIVFLGDYVDRGPNSRGVIERLRQGLAEGRNWICLKGNHDRLFEWFVAPPVPRQDSHLLIGYHWFHERLGGLETAQSYGVDVPERIRQKELAAEFRAALPDGHLAFLQGLQLSHREMGKFFVHAGVRPGVPLADQDEEDLLWIRQEFLEDTRDHGALIVHGHTPVKAPELKPNRLNLDTGAGYGRPMSIAVFEADEIFALGRSGRVRL